MTILDVLMRRYGLDGYAAAAAWLDVQRRGHLSPWWPEVCAATTFLAMGNAGSAFAAVRVMMQRLHEQIALASPAVATLFGRLAVPKIAHPTLAARLTLPVLRGGSPAFTLTDETKGTSDDR